MAIYKLGYDSVGGSNTAITTKRSICIWNNRVTMDGNFELTGDGYVYASTGAGETVDFRIAVYRVDSTSTMSDNDLISQSNTLSLGNNTAAGWQKLTGLSGSLEDGKTYCTAAVAVITSGSYPRWKSDSMTWGYSKIKTLDGVTMPDSLDGYSANNYYYSQYVEYTEASSGGTNMQINIGDTWKTVTKAQINIGDTWKPVTKVQVNIGDTWKTVF